MAKILIPNNRAKDLAPAWMIASAMSEASNCCVIFDTENLQVYPASDEFHAVIEEVSENDIEFSDFYGVDAPKLAEG